MSTTTIERIRGQLLAAYERRKGKPGAAGERLTMDRLRLASGLPLTRSALHRKLHGGLTLTIDEAQAVARALGVKVAVAVTRRAA